MCQRVTAYIHIAEIEHLLLPGVFLLSSSMDQRRRKTNTNLFNSKPIEIGLRDRFILTIPSL
jgi:hypothetical protein